MPHIPEGRLRNEIMSIEESLGFKMKRKYVEMQGRTISKQLVRKDPNPVGCGRETCFSYRSRPGSCTRQGVVYSAVCLKYKVAGLDTVYYGETARTLFDRGKSTSKP